VFLRRYVSASTEFGHPNSLVRGKSPKTPKKKNGILKRKELRRMSILFAFLIGTITIGFVCALILCALQINEGKEEDE